MLPASANKRRRVWKSELVWFDTDSISSVSKMDQYWLCVLEELVGKSLVIRARHALDFRNNLPKHLDQITESPNEGFGRVVPAAYVLFQRIDEPTSLLLNSMFKIDLFY